MEIEAKSPLTGEVIKKIPEATDREVEEAYKQAKEASEAWGSKPIEKRIKSLKNVRKTIIDNLDNITETISLDTGKVETEALMADILPTLEQIKYYEKKAPEILKTEKRKTPKYFRKNKSIVQYDPMGVVSIISPWNYPFQLSMIPLMTALVAGNTVLLKPSENTPLVGEKIGEVLKDTDIGKNTVHILQGGKRVGEKLIEINPDKIFFTGSTEVGKEILKNAAESLIPTSLELGGKDPMIVHRDANLERASSAAVYGAFSNTGQICVSIERIYVHEKRYTEFLEKVKQKTKQLKIGFGPDADIGPMTTKEQTEKVMEHIKDAEEKGAKIEIGGERKNQYIYPTILTKVKHKMKIMTEETFGPTMPIKKYGDLKNAIEQANQTKYGLNASIWTEDRKIAKKIQNKLQTGNIYINDTVKNIGNPSLPFGGVKQSGLGRYHGSEGLKTFSHTKSIMINKNKKEELNWFPYTQDKQENIKKAIKTFHADISPIKKIKNLITLLRET